MAIEEGAMYCFVNSIFCNDGFLESLHSCSGYYAQWNKIMMLSKLLMKVTLLICLVIPASILGQECTESIESLKKAAENGDTNAQYKLGYKYFLGDGVTKDYSKAMEWSRLAAEKREPTSQFVLGVMYEYGQGVDRDSAEAVKWYRLAAEQGHIAAQVNLGVMYLITEDYSEAMKWFHMVLNRGVPMLSIN